MKKIFNLMFVLSLALGGTNMAQAEEGDNDNEERSSSARAGGELSDEDTPCVAINAGQTDESSNLANTGDDATSSDGALR